MNIEVRQTAEALANMARQCERLVICTYGRNGFEVQRQGRKAFVANGPDWWANYLAAVEWAEQHPEVA